ncbi:hypothetical protein AGMMS49545_02510 [Betaproteobacteria bacterium]|nr:hypothetical protein AGMMS49545_02510 [Betaproteobacteria bacterium]GHU40245.1 hypothetical protein AGMMS50289_01480 [Betaproteobacteria bacterium]
MSDPICNKTSLPHVRALKELSLETGITVTDLLTRALHQYRRNLEGSQGQASPERYYQEK